MAAGFETAVDTRGESTFLKDSMGMVISKALAAKVMADKEREYAKKQALKQGMDEAQFDAMNPPGYFFKKALVGEFGGFAIKKKKQELAALYRKALLVGKAAKNKRLRGKVVKQLKQSLIYSKANLKNAKRFRSQFDYTNWEEYLAPQSEKLPKTRKKVQNALGGGTGKRVSREQIIESIDAIAKSIERTAQSITQSSTSVYGTLITSNQLQADVAQDLKIRNSTLEDKLQKLVDVISNQTQTQKEFIDKKEAKQSERALEAKTVAAGAETPDDLSTKKDESRSFSSFANEQAMMDPYLQQSPEVKPFNSMVNDLPAMEAMGFHKAERGGMFGKGGVELHGTEALVSNSGVKIVSGPDSGYLHEIKEPSEVVPINNNFTQGEQSAVDGKTRPAPKSPMINNIQKFEMGTKNKYDTANTTVRKFEMGTKNKYDTANTTVRKFEMGTRNPYAPAALNINTGAEEPVMETMDLAMMTAGGGILASTTNLINSFGANGDEIKPELDKVTRSVADVYGLPSTIVTKASGTKTTAKRTEDEDKKEEDSGEKKKGLFDKLKEGFGKFMELLGNKINDTDPSDPNGMGGPGGGGDGAGAASAMELIAGSEGGYNSINMGVAGDTPGGAKSVLGKDLVDMTVGEVMDAQANKGVHAAGKYQIVPSTMKDFVSKMGISRDDKFDQATQEKFKDYVAQHARPKVGEFISGKLGEDKIDEVVMSLAQEFASVGVPYDTTGHRGQKISKGQSYYAGIGGNRANVDPDVLKQKLLQDRQQFLAGKTKPKPATPVAGNPPGALAPGQRPDKSLSTEQWKVQQQALQEASAMGLTGAAKDKYVAEKVMAVPSPIFQRPSQDAKMSLLGEISTNPRQNAKPQIVALNTGGDKASTAGAATPPSLADSTIPSGRNPLKDSGLYIG